MVTWKPLGELLVERRLPDDRRARRRARRAVGDRRTAWRDSRRRERRCSERSGDDGACRAGGRRAGDAGRLRKRPLLEDRGTPRQPASDICTSGYRRRPRRRGGSGPPVAARALDLSVRARPRFARKRRVARARNAQLEAELAERQDAKPASPPRASSKSAQGEPPKNARGPATSRRLHDPRSSPPPLGNRSQPRCSSSNECSPRRG